MIIAFGQQRTAREGIRAGDLVLPVTDGELPAETLVTSEIIAALIATHYESAMQHGRIASIRLADGQIRPDQRFYDREIEVAAQILARRAPTTESAQNWYLLMKQYMGYRVVPVPFCSYGEEPDTVTRQCVARRAERAPAAVKQPEPGPEREAKSSLILPLGIVGIVALLMLGGRK
ncbi:hypothetical protein LCGC14_0990210 [marine sediment metagenome]|uniref:Uncharacterized protein n=1 Tax=marine sediment metagenome TaxID=412755 RepID=A0A0F9NAK8_9ZZZZ